MDPTTPMPATLNDAIASGPLWLQTWVLLLVVTHLAALLFIPARREGGGLRVRLEPLAIVLSFVAAGAFMSWLYQQVGYVRLLGLAHLIFWGPVWIWLFRSRERIGTVSTFGLYLRVYLVVAGISLVIDVIDVVRYLLGDGALLPPGA